MKKVGVRGSNSVELRPKVVIGCAFDGSSNKQNLADNTLSVFLRVQ